MAGYYPLKITGNQTGLVQEREEFILPNDAYPILENAYVWRERILRKKGYVLVGRLQRNLSNQSLGNSIATGVAFNIFTLINITGTVTNVTQANPGVVTTGTPHLLQTGQIVTFSNILGMIQLNGNSYSITVTGPSTFQLTNINTTAYTAYISGGNWVVDSTSLEPDKTIVPGSVIITMPGPIVFTDQGNGTLTSVTPGNSGVINYISGSVTLTTTAGAGTSTITFSYNPNLPVMGIRTEELTNSANDETIFFDQVYAYNYNQNIMSFEEFIPGTTWNASMHPISGTDFFWSTNYWVSDGVIFTGSINNKLFWETNNTGSANTLADPPRITDGVTWVSWYTQSGAQFTHQPWIQIDGDPTYILNWLSMLPYRGRMVVFNTWEGASPSQSKNYPNRVRWSTIGNPFLPYFNAVPPAASTGSWRDDIRGQGGFLDIPTSEDIISIGFVRDNLVIYCERSTWQLRYTGRSISPFQIERVNSELGGQGPISAVQFDTSLVGIGDKGIVECDSYQSKRIDIKIPDFVFDFQPGTSLNNAPFRVHGVRDFINRLAYWTVPLADSYDPNIPPAFQLFPNQRLVYNYENDSWALFTDSLTAVGNFQPLSSRNWVNTHIPWIRCNFPWVKSQPAQIPSIVGGNQQGFIEYLNNDAATTNDPSLYISAITPNVTTPTVITSPNHNMHSNFVIEISGIPIGTPYASSLNSPQAGLITGITQANPAEVTSSNHSLVNGAQILINGVVGMTQLNGIVFTITVVDANNFTLNGIDSTAYTPYSSGGTWTNQSANVFSIFVIDEDTFSLMKYDPSSGQFDIDQLDNNVGTYIGGGIINIRENFSIVSKKFNFLDEGQNIQLGYIDILMSSTASENPGAISLNVYLDYDPDSVSNIVPDNQINNGMTPAVPDTFFNSVIPTTGSFLNGIGGQKFWQRVYCATRANFLTLEYTFSNAQMNGIEQEQDVQIDAQVLWIRKAGKMTQI